MDNNLNINLAELISEHHQSDSKGGVVIDHHTSDNRPSNDNELNPSTNSSATPFEGQVYPGDIEDNSGPLETGGYRKLDFPNPAILIAFYNDDFQYGTMQFYQWQVECLEELSNANSSATSRTPFKYCLCTCNGSGKDFIVIAGWAIWFALCKIKSRCIITSSSGVQLTAQTENYIKDLALLINKKHGCEIFKIRQRYIKCLLSGSEIRLFATDEKGKAEGYHPWGAGEMCIIVNEGKTVTDDIHSALKRCTGYNYWLEVSSTGEARGFFYRAFNSWKHTRRVTAYECPHISPEEIESDKIELGENSPLFRSIYLALFTSLSGTTIIPETLIAELLSLRDSIPDFPSLQLRIGLDLAAGGDETSVCARKGSKCKKQVHFRETNTEVTAARIDLELHRILRDELGSVNKEYKYIFADDGGVGRSIIDKLIALGWVNINRVRNDLAAINSKLYGNRGAENWYRVLRILEEHYFDISTLDEKTREQLYTRQYKQKMSGGKLYLESKQEAKAHGRVSPDRADSYVLTYIGEPLDSFLNAEKILPLDNRPRVTLKTSAEVYEHYENEVTFGKWKTNKVELGKRRIYGSLKRAMSAFN